VRRFLVPLVVLYLLSAAGCSVDDGARGFEVSRDERLAQVKPEKPVRIQLKRNAKGVYSWEIRGDNVDRILEADRKLRQSLSRHQ